MNDQSIEFQKIMGDKTLPEIVRKSFRIPVEDTEDVWVVIDKSRYPVLDICLDGIGIVLENNSVFTIEQALLNCELNIYGESIKDLNGKVVHFFSRRKKDWQCGIQWIDMEKRTADQISKIFFKMKEQLLKENNIPFDQEQNISDDE